MSALLGEIDPPRRSVILLEDDEFIGSLLKNLLGLEGYEVTLATTLRAATAAAKRIDGDCVVLLDPMMPGVTPRAVLASVLGEGHTLILMSVVVFPSAGGSGDPFKHKPQRRLSSAELLVEMVRETFADKQRDALCLPSRIAA